MINNDYVNMLPFSMSKLKFQKISIELPNGNSTAAIRFKWKIFCHHTFRSISSIQTLSLIISFGKHFN